MRFQKPSLLLEVFFSKRSSLKFLLLTLSLSQINPGEFEVIVEEISQEDGSKGWVSGRFGSSRLSCARASAGGLKAWVTSFGLQAGRIEAFG